MLGTGSDRTKAAVELTGRSEKLGSKEIRASLAFLVSSIGGGRVRLDGGLTASYPQILVPYVRSKAQDYYEQLGGGVDSDLYRDAPAQAHLLEVVSPAAPSTMRGIELILLSRSSHCDNV